MKDMVSSIAVGHLGGEVVIDLDGHEEHFDGEVADIPIAVIPSTGEITLLQMDGMTDAKLITEAIRKGRDEIEAIAKVQRQAVKDRFPGEMVGFEEAKKHLKKKIKKTNKKKEEDA